jgi:hypothetical protein
MPVLIHFGGGELLSLALVVVLELVVMGRKVSRIPAWSYCSAQGKEKVARAERKVESGALEGFAVGAFLGRGRG